MMTKEEAIQVLMDAAGHDLNKIKDAYQHGMLALEIAKTISATGVQLSELGGKASEQPAKKKAPVKKEEAKVEKPKEELVGTPVSAREEKETMEMLAVPSRYEEEQAKEVEKAKAAATNESVVLPDNAPVPTVNDLQSSPALYNMNPRAQVPGAAPAPEAAPEPATPAPKAEIDITSDEWKNKHLTSDEVDNTWTDRMKANVEMVRSAQTLRKVCVNGIQSGKIQPAWLNERIKEASDGMFDSYQDRNIYNPPYVRLISAYIAGKVNELFRKAA